MAWAILQGIMQLTEGNKNKTNLNKYCVYVTLSHIRYMYEIVWYNKNFEFKTWLLTILCLACEIYANLVSTLAGTILFISYEFTGPLFYFILLFGAVASLHMVLYEIMQI